MYFGLWEWKLSRDQKVNSSSYDKGLRNLGRKSGSQVPAYLDSIVSLCERNNSPKGSRAG